MPTRIAKKRTSAMPWACAANWVVGLSAAALIAVSLIGYLYHRRQLGAIAAEHLRLVVTGPAELHPGVASRFLVTTTTVTGEPAASQIEFRLYSPDEPLEFRLKEASDKSGQLGVEIPSDLALPRQSGSVVQVKVLATAKNGQRQEEAGIALPVKPASYLAQLSLSKGRFQPGETVYFRLLALSRLAQAADRPLPIRFEVLDPAGAVVPGSQQEGRSEGGAASSAFPLPKQLPDGRYAVIARSLDGAFPEETAPFTVLPHFKKEVAFSRDGYAPGETVAGKLFVRRAEGSEVGSPSLKIVATVDGQTVFQRFAQADATGRLPIEFTLPPKIERGQGQLVVEADESGFHETLTKTIPIRTGKAEPKSGKVEVQFYPEGGDMVPGLENRVYFAARDPRGKPVAIQGTIVDSQGDVALVETTHDGTGSFAIRPKAAETYRLKITSPADVTERIKLPPISREKHIVMSTGTGVFEAGAPLEFSLRAAKADMPLVVTAWCRGIPVGQQMLVTSKKQKDADVLHPVSIPLDSQVGGVIRVTVYDYGGNPPKPVAERLVYRRVARRLTVQKLVDKADHSDFYSPGDKAQITLEVADEDGQPVPAMLSVSVVSSAAAGTETMGSAPRFFLATGIEKPEDLENAEFYLSDSKDAAAALDLLLGTQGWRQVTQKAAEQAKAAGHHQAQVARLAAVNGPVHPPAMSDNLGDLRSKYEESLTRYREKQTRLINAMITLSFFGGLGLALLVTMLGLLKIIAGVRLWGPMLGAAVCCFVAGAVLMDPSRLKSVDGVAVPFTPFHLDAKAAAVAPVPGDAAARPFAAAHYAHQRVPGAKDEKTGVADTLYWQPRLAAGADGHCTIRFDLPDSPGEFVVLVDAQHDGRMGSNHWKIISAARAGGK